MSGPRAGFVNAVEGETNVHLHEQARTGKPVETGPAGHVASHDGVTESLHELTQRARKDPAVSRLLTEFGAQVVDVRPLRPGVDDAGKPLVVEEGG